MIQTLEFKDSKYPLFQSQGNAAQFAIPYAKHVCLGLGIDVGCMKPEWAIYADVDAVFTDKEAYLSSEKSTKVLTIDPAINQYHALDIPLENLDFIFSSHCLEHIIDWVSVLDYWYEKLQTGGTLFLYLPDYSQVYWRPWNNRKHVNILTPEYIQDYMADKGYINTFVSGVDLNNAFMVMGQK
jgi:SAM-dependent methyltransferase